MKNQSNILRNFIKKCNDLSKEVIQEIKFRRKLKKMDSVWDMGFKCFGLPPSFYYTHTKEEIELFLNELREEFMNDDITKDKK